MSYTITEISQAVKRTERVNLYLNGAFWIGLGKNDLISLRLTQGKVITEAEKQGIEEVSRTGKVLESALRYIHIRPRSCAEVRDYLVLRKSISKEEAESVISYLQEKEFLSDEKFTQWYIEYKLNAGVNGINKIKMELLQKKVDRKIIDEALQAVTTVEEFANGQLSKTDEYAQKVVKTLKAKNSYELKSKLVQRLMARGFTYTDIKAVLALEIWRTVFAK